MSAKNHPGIYIPPPLIYLAFFLLSILLQKAFSLNTNWLDTTAARITGWLLIVLYFVLVIPAIRRFVLSKNTLVTIKPANSLQTSGIYSFTRNPMYLSLLLLYSGLAILLGNWWTFILLPFLIIVVQLYVIKREENYLRHAFGEQYEVYMKRVRRWI